MEERNEYNKERLDRSEKAEKERVQQKAQRKAYVDLVASVRSDCNKKHSGLQAVKYKLEYLQRGGIPLEGFAVSTAIEAYKEGINQYEENEKRKNDKKN